LSRILRWTALKEQGPFEVAYFHGFKDFKKNHCFGHEFASVMVKVIFNHPSIISPYPSHKGLEILFVRDSLGPEFEGS